MGQLEGVGEVTPQDKLRLAGNVIGYGKALAPDRFPAPSELTLVAWADVLGSINVPEAVWPEAVRLWATELAGERMVTPRDLLKAARVVLSRWESDPVRGEELRAFREARREARDRELAAGTYAASRGYRAPVRVEVARVPQRAIDAAREVLGTPGKG